MTIRLHITLFCICVCCNSFVTNLVETINTKFAMKELSMMFSSPAVEIGSARRRQNYSNNSRIDESVAYMGKADASIGDVGDGILLDNSICNTASEKLCDEQTPFVDFMATRQQPLSCMLCNLLFTQT